MEGCRDWYGSAGENGRVCNWEKLTIGEINAESLCEVVFPPRHSGEGWGREGLHSPGVFLTEY